MVSIGLSVFNKFYSVCKILCSFKSLLANQITKPRQTANIAWLLYRIQDSLKNPNTASAVCETLDLIVEFKEKSPEDYAEIFALIGKILEEYVQNKDSIKQNLQELL